MLNKKNQTKKEIDDILKFKIVNKLKSIYRLNSVENRHESTAEHTWSALVLADYLINKHNLKLNRLKVYELLMYHDLAEIHAGDCPLSPELEHLERKKRQKEAELASAKKLKSELPKTISDKYYQLFVEFEEGKTSEAKFARLVDVFDAQIHEIDYKKDWKGWTKEFVVNNKRVKCFDNFPEIKKEFLSLMNYMEEQGYFNQ